jgi:hypothetical protein
MTADNPLEKFLQTYETKSTRDGHRSHLNCFFRTLGAEPNTYFSSGRNYEEDYIKMY